MDNINAQVIDAELIHKTILAIKACVVTSQTPSVLTKTRKLDKESGNIISQQGGHLVQGIATNVQFSSMQEFAEFIDKAKTNQALIAATHTAEHTPEQKSVQVLSRDAYKKAGSPNNAITRTKSNFARGVNQQGLLILDCDDKNISKDEFLKAIRQVIPLDDVAHVYTTSSSSYLYVNGELKQGDKGKRLYIAIADASDTERAGQVLFDRLWLNGHGYYIIGAAGQFLDRGIIDTAMFKDSCRLDFISGSHCIEPVSQKRPPAEYNEGQPLNTLLELTDLNKAERERLDAIKGSAKATLEAKANKVKAQYCESKGRENLTQRGITAPTAEQLEEATKNVLKALDNSSLTGDFVVTLANSKRKVTIAEILTNTDLFDGVEVCDPLEPNYNNWASVGKLLLKNGRPKLHSFAHGGKTYNLIRQSRFIEHVAGRTAETTNKTLEIMQLLGNYFDLGDQLVSVKGNKIMPMTEDLLRYELGDNVQFYATKTNKQGQEMQVHLDPPRDVIKYILALGPQRDLKKLNAVITAPTITPTGYVVSKRGYDEQTGLYLATTQDITPPPSKPTTEQVMDAYRLLMSVLDTFKLNTRLDRSVALSAVLSAVARPTLDTATGYIMDAPTYGSGKTYLAKCLALLGTGESPAMTPAIQNNEPEIQKTILSLMMTGARAIIWDNVRGSFNSATIAVLLTHETYSGRVLGASEHTKLPNKASFYITSNNARINADLSRRFLTIRLDTGEENAINAKRDLSALKGAMPDQYIRKNRQRLVTAALTLINGYLNSEAHQTQGRVTTNVLLASYEQWDVLARQPVAWLASLDDSLNLCDPKLSIDEAMANDPEKEALTLMLNALYEWRGNMPFTARQLHTQRLSICPSNDELFELFESLSNRQHFNTKSVGDVLSYRVDRIADGMQLKLYKKDPKRGHQYRVIKI